MEENNQKPNQSIQTNQTVQNPPVEQNAQFAPVKNSKSKPKSKFSRAIIGLLILLTIIGSMSIYVLAWYYSAPYIKGWKTYVSLPYGIRVQYPDNWSVKECVLSLSDVIELIPEGEPILPCSHSMALTLPRSGFVLGLRTSQLRSDTYQQALKYPYMNTAYNTDSRDFKRESVKVSSYEAVRASGINSNGVKFTNYVVNLHGRPLLIYYSKTPPTLKDYKDTADKIISTIKFII